MSSAISSRSKGPPDDGAHVRDRLARSRVAPGASHVRPHPRRRARATELVELFGNALQSALQSADADYDCECEEPPVAVGVAGAIAREVRSDGARGGGCALYRPGAERRHRPRCRDGPGVLDLLA